MEPREVSALREQVRQDMMNGSLGKEWQARIERLLDTITKQQQEINELKK